jgi:hypothetical protein
MCATAQTPPIRGVIFSAVARKLNTPSVAPMQELREPRHVRAQLELSLGDYNVNGASIGCSGSGAKFAFTIGPISDAAVAALVATAHHHGTIRLLLPQPLLLDLVAVERQEPQRVRIAGRIVGSAADATEMESRGKRAFAI